MPITIFYDSTRNAHEDGSPPWASHTEFKKLGPNSVFTATEVEDDADASVPETPCAQNLVDGYVLINGPYDAYDVIVGVSGLAEEKPTLTGTGRFTGGLTWRILDGQQVSVATGYLRANNLPPPPLRAVPFGAGYPMRIPNGIKTRVCGCSTSGGITIPPAASFYVSIKVDVTLMWWVQPLAGLINVSGGIQVPVPVPNVPGIIVPGGDLSFSNMLLRNLQTAAGGFLRAFDFQKSSEDFQDPELRKQIGLSADALESPETLERLEQVRQTIGKPFRER